MFVTLSSDDDVDIFDYFDVDFFENGNAVIVKKISY